MAWRYLRGAEGRAEGRRFLRFVMGVGVGGVAMGVAALLLALSIVRGFSREIEAKIIGFGAHVQVESYTDGPLQEADALAERLGGFDGVAEVDPVVLEFALLRRSAEQIDGVAIWGAERMPPYLAANVVDGSDHLAVRPGAPPPLVVGKQLAALLGLAVGDRVTAFSTRGLAQPLEGGFRRPRVKQFVVAGIYETDLADFDEIYAFAPLAPVRDLFEYASTEVTRLDLTLHDPAGAEVVASVIGEEVGFPVMARSIYEVYRNLFAWVNLQESIVPLVIGVIILVAAFNIMGTLLMIVLEKTREVGIFSSLGTSARTLRRLFLGLGLLIGAVGTALGALVALVLALLQQRYDLIPLPAEAYYMTSAPIALHPLDFLLVAVVTLVLCGLSAYVPARVAARVEPVRAIRFR